MNLRFVALTALALASGACATACGYQRILDSWTGVEISRLIENWGPPADTYTMPDGRELYTWYFDGGAVAMPIGNMAYAVQRYCRTTFTVGQNGMVERWRDEGNSCKA